MADGTRFAAFEAQEITLDIQTAIACLRAGSADRDFKIDLGGDLIIDLRQEEDDDALMKRLEAFVQFEKLLNAAPSDAVQPMQSGKPVLHSRVATILDALRKSA